MRDIYEEMIAASEQIASSFPPPRFYACCENWLNLSRSLFSENEKVTQCRAIVGRRLEDNFGHGMEHAQKVAVEAGALLLIEVAKMSISEEERCAASVMVHLAGLLHDVRRGEKDHAHAGAEEAERILGELLFPREKKDEIVQAIANHEAFTKPTRMPSAVGQVISDALYDADKFRWGPDNFTLTLWTMLRSRQASIVRMIRRYPKGMQGITGIKDTFRTEPGKTYGPEFIDLGLKIGEKIYEFLQERFAAELAFEDR